MTGRPYAESELSVLSRARQLHDVTRGRRAPSYLVSPTCSAIGASRALPPFAHSSHLSLLPPSPNSPHNDPAKYSLFAAASHRIRSLEVPHTLISKVIIIIFQRGAIARILVSLSLSPTPLLPPSFLLLPYTCSAYVTAPRPQPTSLPLPPTGHRIAVFLFFPCRFQFTAVGTGDPLSSNRDLDLDRPRFSAQAWVAEERAEAVHRMSRL